MISLKIKIWNNAIIKINAKCPENKHVKRNTSIMSAHTVLVMNACHFFSRSLFTFLEESMEDALDCVDATAPLLAFCSFRGSFVAVDGFGIV